MKINIVSDLHLEFYDQILAGGEVLIIAGDVAECHSIIAGRGARFFQEECAKYNRVFYVMGNHEHYNGFINQTADKLRRFLPKNVSLLENQVEEYGGIQFIGATLWTDVNRGCPLDMYNIKRGMNDYHIIKILEEGENDKRILSPAHTAKMHEESKKFIFDTVSNSSIPSVVITHHAPSYLSIHENYKSSNINSAYASELTEHILDNQNIKFWIHGHVHTKFDYMIGGTRVITNPRGYVGYEATHEFDPNFYIEI